jgi:hypothetical protein
MILIASDINLVALLVGVVLQYNFLPKASCQINYPKCYR